jgi:hypothetical protein
VLTYSECKKLMASARNPASGKPLENNTRLYEREGAHAPGGTYYAVRFHNTDIVEIYANGTFGIRHGGWTTASTRDRIRSYAPVDWRQLYGKVDTQRSDSDGWYLRLRPNAEDPHPNGHECIKVEVPFPKPPEPAAEPVSEDYGTCWDGQRVARTALEVAFIYEERDLRPNDRPKIYKDLSALTGARHMLAWLEQLMPARSYTGMPVERPVTTVTDYGSHAYRWQRPDFDHYGHGRETTKYEQCAHCKRFQSAHSAWEAAVRRWDFWHAQVETYGSLDAWREARRDDRRDVIAANRARAEWELRNRIDFDGLMRINADGYPLQSEVRAVKAVRYQERMAANRRRRADERRAIEARQLDRFRRGLRRRRKLTFEERARETADMLASIRENIDIANSERES